MRPLPLLTDLAPSPDVFTPATDDFNLLNNSSMSTYDTLQSLLDSTTDPAVAASGSNGIILDTIGSVFDGIDGTFGQLDNSLSQLSYEQQIQDTLALDNAFSSGLSSWTFDAAGALTGFLQDVASAIESFFADIISLLGQVAGVIFNSIEDVFVWIWQGIAQAIAVANAAIELAVSCLAEISFLGGTGGPPSSIGTGF